MGKNDPEGPPGEDGRGRLVKKLYGIILQAGASAGKAGRIRSGARWKAVGRRSPAKTSQGHAKECALGRRSSVFIGNLQLDGAQVDRGFVATDLHLPIAGGEPCQED